MAGYKREKNLVITESGETHVIIGPRGAKVPSGGTKLTVGAVEKLTGVKASTLRHYNNIGLLCPARTGEGVSNNRKLYDADDLGRLQTIQTLQAYGFDLDEIGHILDKETDLHEVLASKLEDLRRQANRLHDLILFTDFVGIADGNADPDRLIEGLACGPANIDELANFARESKTYEIATAFLEDLDEDRNARAFESLEEALMTFFERDETCGFAGVDTSLEAFRLWWDTFFTSLDTLGYLGFWAVFEDQSIIAEQVEALGRPGDAGSIQMYLFFAWMVKLAQEAGKLIAEVARLADEDVVAALEVAHELIGLVAQGALGFTVTELDPRDTADVAFIVLSWLAEIVADGELRAYLGLDEGLAFELEELEKALALVDMLGSEE